MSMNTFPTKKCTDWASSNKNMENKTGVGSIIAAIIIIALIILGGLYFWGKRIEEAKSAQSFETNTSRPTVIIDQTQNEASAIRAISSSDDIASIETDLKATTITGLDGELGSTTP